MAARKLNRLSVLLASTAVFVMGSVALAQPELQVQSDPQPARPGQPYRITCQVTWEGAPDAYTILPAEVDPVDWATVRRMPTNAFQRDGKNVVVETIELTPTKEGEEKTPAILIPYLRPEDLKRPEKPDTPTHLNASDAPPKLRADPFPLLVQPHTTPAWLFGVLGALFLLILAAAWRLVRRRPSPVSPQSATPPIDFPAVQARIQSAKQLRINGDFYAVYKELSAAADLMDSRAPELAAALKSRAEEVGYRGLRPTEDQLEGDLRDLEHVLARETESREP